VKRYFPSAVRKRGEGRKERKEDERECVGTKHPGIFKVLQAFTYI
jgi:hypothetical protein